MTSLYHDATIDRTDKRRRTIGIENQHKSLHRDSGKSIASLTAQLVIYATKKNDTYEVYTRSDKKCYRFS